MANDTLKPCPFCGNDAMLNEYKARSGYEASVQCSQCSASIASITYDTQQEATEEVVIEWNRRAYEAEIADLKRGIIHNPENAYVMGFPMLNLLVLADALYKKGVSVEQVDDFIAEVGNAYEYCFREQEKTMAGVIRRLMNIDEFEVKV